MSGGIGIRAGLRTRCLSQGVWVRVPPHVPNGSMAKLVKAVDRKSVIVCSNQTGASKCTSGGMVDTSVSGADAERRASSNLAL